MRKLKIPILIFGTLGLLILFALLPKLVFSVLDIQEQVDPSFTDMVPVQLDISTGNSSITMLDKLALLSSSKAIDITQDQMFMQEEEVYEAVQAFLTQLESAGICHGFEPSEFSMQPKLVYDLSDSSRNFTLWTISFSRHEEPSQSLMLDVDDETGKILSVRYSIYREYSMEGVWERNKAVIDIFAELYFDQLAMSEIVASVKANPSFDLGYAYNEVDGGVSEAYYTLSNSDAEKFTIAITVDGAGGFSVTIL